MLRRLARSIRRPARYGLGGAAFRRGIVSFAFQRRHSRPPRPRADDGSAWPVDPAARGAAADFRTRWGRGPPTCARIMAAAGGRTDGTRWYLRTGLMGSFS